jgi:hypothetical protein
MRAIQSLIIIALLIVFVSAQNELSSTMIARSASGVGVQATSTAAASTNEATSTRESASSDTSVTFIGTQSFIPVSTPVKPSSTTTNDALR